ncbi:hypothetical protein [Streptomyces sp. NPDC057496]|uniref:hypothetical protein n=1 Tax=Streptomyces sp. NPDC057496 TaxID=3346149 RepID=UPI00369878B9
MSVVRRFLVAAVSSAAALALSATSASAVSAGPWTVGNPNADGSFSGSLKAGTAARILDVRTAQEMDCYGPETRVEGSMPSGTHSDGEELAGITAFSWGTPDAPCHGPLGMTITAGQLGAGMEFSAESHAGGVTTGRLTGVAVAFAAETLFGRCTMTISGSLDHVTYDNSTGELSITDGAGLVMSDVSEDGSCMGLLDNGHQVEYSATYVLDEPLTVTSP